MTRGLGWQHNPRNPTFMRPILLLAVLLLYGCNADRIAQLEAENRELKAQVAEVQRASNLDLQAKCSKDAKAFFEAWQVNPSHAVGSADYTNHYSRSQNRCFIVIANLYTIGEGERAEVTSTRTLYDVYENKDYAMYIEKPGPKGTVEVVRCSIGTASCKTRAEFDALLTRYMD